MSAPKMVGMTAILVLAVLCGCVSTPLSTPVAVRFTMDANTNGVVILYVVAQDCGKDVLLKFAYEIRENRQLWIYNPPIGDIIRVIGEAPANQRMVSVSVRKKQLLAVDGITVNFFMENSRENGLVYLDFSDIAVLLGVDRPPVPDRVPTAMAPIEVRFESLLLPPDLTITGLTATPEAKAIKFTIKYTSRTDRRVLLFNSPSGGIFKLWQDLPAAGSEVSVTVPNDSVRQASGITIRFLSGEQSSGLLSISAENLGLLLADLPTAR